MKYLVDSHVLLWWMTDDERLTPLARNLLANAENELWFSAGSAWKIAIKWQAGRIELDDAPGRLLPELLRESAISILPVMLDHVLLAATLPMHHKDPFDRLLVAQSRLEQLILITADAQIRRYDVDTLF